MFETLDQEYTNKRRSNIDNLENLLLFSSFMFKIYSNTMYSYTPNQSFQSNKYHLSAEIHSADFKQIVIFRTFIDGLNFYTILSLASFGHKSKTWNTKRQKGISVDNTASWKQWTALTVNVLTSPKCLVGVYCFNYEYLCN